MNFRNIVGNEFLFFLFQPQQWPQQKTWQTNGFDPNTQMRHDWGQQVVVNHSQNVPQQMYPQSAFKQFPATTFAPKPHARITCKLHAFYNTTFLLLNMIFNIFFFICFFFSVIPNTKGELKASIVKRKRKRTMFTTEQIQTLESFYKRRPYITREERQMFVDNLHISDSSVKVWFQNRRLREKRDKEEREAEALELANSTNEETFYSTNNPSFEMSTPSSTPSTSDLSNYFSMATFDPHPVISSAIEMENLNTPDDFDVNQLLNGTYANVTESVIINQKNEDSGFDSDSSRVTSDGLINAVIESNIEQERVNSMQTIQETAITVESFESSSSPNLNHIEAEIERKTDQFGYVTLDDKAIGDLVSVLDNILPSNVNLETPTEVEETVEDSDSTIYAGSIYEPISPVSSEVDDELLKARWEPFAPEKSLQKLFDLHFC